MAITQCAWEWKQWARRDEITALHFWGHTGRHKDNPPAARRQGRRISRSLSSGPRGGSNTEIRNRGRKWGRGGGGEEDVTVVWLPRWRFSRPWNWETKVSDWNSNADSLFLLVYRNPQRIEWCCQRLSSVLVTVLEKQREEGSARVKEQWSDRSEEGGRAGRDCRKEQITVD